MLRLKKIADVMRMSADALEGYYKERDEHPSTEAAKLIKELRKLTTEIRPVRNSSIPRLNCKQPDLPSCQALSGGFSVTNGHSR